MESEEEQFRMNHAGLVARSTAGHAARGMKIKDQDNMWINIQHHTFRNWVNVQLRDTGLKVEDLSEDLRDGVALVTLVEILQKRNLRKVRKVNNQHQALENVTSALNAIAEDGIKLVNIGNVDIVNGNLKLILGLVWSLIMHYQIGQSKFPPKKFMHSWLKSVLPDCKVGNFTTDWNSGINLSALVDYCKPGVFRNWKNLDPNNGTENCRHAMEIAKREFNIPMVLEPEYLSSPYLDDLSGMTYLSYFMKEGGPGYSATLDWVQHAIPECNVTNFTTDWNDGHALSTLVKKLGGPVPGYKTFDKDHSKWEKNIQIAQEGGRKLGVEAVLGPHDMARQDVEYLGPMAYVANYQWITAKEPASEAIRVKCDHDNVRINNPVSFKLEYLVSEVVRSEIKVHVNGPHGPVRTELNFGPRGAKGEFTPSYVGFHEIIVTYEEETVEGCPVRVRALPDVSKAMVKGGLEPCAIGSIVEVLINSNGTGRDGEMDVKAYAPSRRVLECPINNEDGVFTAMFKPDEPGEWSIAVTYEDQHIQGSPFHCHVYDPNAIQVLNLNDGPKAPTGKPFTLLLDSAACGFGDVKTDVTLAGVSQPSKTLEVDQNLYEVTFTPFEAAKYRIYVYFNGHEVKGSPFNLYLGVEKPPERKSKAKKVKKSSSNKDSKDINEIVKEYATIRHKSGADTLVKTFDSSLDRSLNKTSNNSYNSLNRSIDRSFDSSTLKTSRTHESSTKMLSSATQEEKASHVPRIISFNFGPESKAQFDVNKNANTPSPIGSPTTNGFHSKSLVNSTLNSSSSNHNNSTDVVDSSFNTSTLNSSSYNSVFNSTSSTVIKTETSTTQRGSSSLFKKESSPARITNWSSRHDSRSSMSPPPPLSPTQHITNYATPTSPSPLPPSSPVGEVGENGAVLSAPARVAQIAKNSARTSEEEYEDEDDGVTKIIKTKRIITEKRYRIHRTVEEFCPSSTPSSPKLSIRNRPTSFSPPPPMTTGTSLQPLLLQSSFRKSESTLLRSESPFRTNSPLLSPSSRPQSPGIGGIQRTLITTVKTSPSPSSLTNPLTPITKNITTTTTSIAESPVSPMSPTGGGGFVPHQLGHRFSKKSSQSSLYSGSSLNSPPPLPTSPPPYFKADNNRSSSETFRKSDIRNLENFRNSDRFRNLESLKNSENLRNSESFKYSGSFRNSESFRTETRGSNMFSSRPYHNRVASPPPHFQRVSSPSPSPHTRTSSTIHNSRLGSFLTPTKSSSTQDIHTMRDYSPLSPTQSFSRNLNSNSNSFSKSRVYSSSVSNLLTEKPPLVARTSTPNSRANSNSRFTSSKNMSTTSNANLSFYRNNNINKPASSGLNPSTKNNISNTDGLLTSNKNNISKTTNIITSNNNANSTMSGDLHGGEDSTLGSTTLTTTTTIKRFQKSTTTTMYGSNGDVRQAISPLPHIYKQSPTPPQATTPTPSPGVGSNRQSSLNSTASTSIDIGDSSPRQDPESTTPMGKVHHITTSVEVENRQDQNSDSKDLISPNKFEDKRKFFEECNNVRMENDAEFLDDSITKKGSLGSSLVMSNSTNGRRDWNSRLQLNDSFDNQNFSSDRKQFMRGDQEYERTSSQFTRESKHYPAGDDRCVVQTREYKYQAKEIPVQTITSDTEFRMIQNDRLLREDSEFMSSKNKKLDRDNSEVRIIQNQTANKKLGRREDSEHEYENVNFKTTLNRTEKSVHTKSYITSRSSDDTGLRFVSKALEPEKRSHDLSETRIYEAKNSRFLNSSNSNVEESHIPMSVKALNVPSVDPSRVSVSGSAVRLVGVHESAEFSLSAPQGLKENDVRVDITGPRGTPVDVKVYPGNEGELVAVFSPTVVGEHLLAVRVGEQHVPNSPFRCYVYDALAIRVGDIPDGVVGTPVEFHIDGSSAGSGNLEILVNGGHVTSHVRNLGEQRFVASFVPHSAILHTVDMTFNGDTVPGSPWRVSVMEGGGSGGVGRGVSVLGDSIKHFPAGQPSVFDISAPGVRPSDVQVHIVSPAKRPVAHQLQDSQDGILHVSFNTTDVGSYVVEVTVMGQKVQGSPFIAKAYDAGLISVSDVPNGVVGQPCQFRVDASQAGEGQLEISINDGEVPNHVQVLGGGRCLVSFTPDTAKTHTIDIKFNGETVRGCPFKCRVSDTSRVTLTLRHLELVPVGRPSAFNISVDGGGSAELTVTVRTPSQSTLPVRVSGSVKSGFMAEFTPQEVGAHTIIVNYNDSAVSGTPFTCKVYDASKVGVSHLPRGAIGKNLQFIVDASEAGEGNLEISISGHGRNIPTQVHPQGSARFAVSFIPLEAIDHVINISFNKEPVAGSPFVAKVQADPNRIVVSGQNLAATAVGKPSYFTIANVTGSVEDVEINVEGPNGLPITAQVQDKGDHTFRVEFCPKVAGEHKIHVAYMGESIPLSPFSCKVYDVNAIKVRPTERGMVGKPVTFLVETNNAGPGNLEVTVNSGQVPTSAQAQGNHEYAISFNPKEARPHVVELRFNGENVPGSPFTCEVVDVSRVTVAGSGLEKVPVDKVASFTVDAQASVDQLGVVVLSPTRKNVASKVVQNADGKLEVLYTPREVGDHTVEVRVAEVLVPGSPFLVKAFDSSKVKVTEVTNGMVSKPVYFSIDASQAGAGNLEIIVSVNNRNVPNYVQSEGHARFRVNFKPKEAAIHTLSVKFNGEPVTGSPFKCRVSDSSQVLIAGAGLKMSSLARPATFTIDPRGTEVGDCRIQVTSPSGAKVQVHVTGEFPKLVNAEFQPTEVGPHSITVSIDGEPATGSPFTCNIYDVTRVHVTGLDNTKVNRPVTFTVDASQAGEGTLELVVTTAKASVRAEVAAKSRGLYDVTFTPHEAIPHFVNITFNEEDVVGSPFKCDVRELEPREVRNIHRKESQMVTAKGDGLKKVVTGNMAAFTVDTKGLDGDLDIRVTGPDGGQIPARIVRMKNGLHRAEYKPEKVGPYNITILHHGSPIATSPFTVEASDPRRVVVEASSECYAGKECGLRVDAAEAGRGALSVGVRAAGQDVKHSIRDLGAGIYQVLFYPKAPVPHKVDVRYNGVPIRSTAFEVPVRNPATGHAVTATGLGLHQARVNKPTAFVIETLNQQSKEFDVLITGPREWAVPVKCYQQKDGNLLAEYTPQAPGSFRIEVLCSGNHVRGSPFQCTAYDASKVVTEKSKTTVAVGDTCKVKLDTSSAGAADIEAHVISPSGAVEPVEINVGQDGVKVLEWEPQDPGQYKITVLYGGEEVPGSPLTVDVGESGLASVSGPGLTRGSVDIPQHFVVDGRGLLGEPQLWVDGPDSVARVNTKKLEEGVFQVTYVPHEVGIFDVRIQWNNREVAGSPFHPKIIDPSRVRLIGGWSDLQDSNGHLQIIPRQETRLAFDVSEAGPGRMKAYLVQDANESKEIDCTVEQVGNRGRVSFIPPSAGSYKLNLFYNDMALPESPVSAYAAPSAGSDHTRVTLKGHGLTSARCGDNAEFVIDGSNAGPGSPDVTISGTKADINVDVKNEGGGIWRAMYTPRLPGAYLLNVMWSDRQVRGCPLKIEVEGAADASRVVCSGDGLRHGMVGQDIKSFIDTRRAGPGELTARCVGPNKMAVCELYDHRDGTFTLNIRPQEAGRHQLTMQYENEHVPGSPFLIKVAGAPDPSKVKVYGPGIEHGVLASYQSRFICDTRGAGAGQLTVRIRGPKGAFRVEMQRESQKDRTILCKYDPTEPGDYRVEVKWSGEHVPGSPYMVMIFDTQDELNRYMAGDYSPGGPGAASDYYGSIGYGAVSIGGAASWRGSQAQL